MFKLTGFGLSYIPYNFILKINHHVIQISNPHEKARLIFQFCLSDFLLNSDLIGTPGVFMVLAVPGKQSFCNSSPRHSVLISFTFLFMPPDTVPGDATIIEPVFTFIFHNQAISYLRGSHMSIFHPPLLDYSCIQGADNID